MRYVDTIADELNSIVLIYHHGITGSGELEFEEFCHLASKFLVEEEDESQVNAELLHWELKEAFRLYDRQGNAGLRQKRTWSKIYF